MEETKTSTAYSSSCGPIVSTVVRVVERKGLIVGGRTQREWWVQTTRSFVGWLSSYSPDFGSRCDFALNS